MSTTTRREFLGEVVAVAGGTSLLAACGDDGSMPDGGMCMPDPEIAGNHGHVLNIPAADVVAGTMQTYDIMGSATHNHQFFVTPAMFSQLQRGTAVTMGTSAGPGDGHNHQITVRCG